MKILKLYMAMCGIFFVDQTVSAQQNMLVVDNNSNINAISVSSVDYATFNVNKKLFSISNDGVQGITASSITADCTVSLSIESGVKTLSITPEVGVCYSKKNSVPTIDDNCLTLGSELKSYTFSLKSLVSGITYYFRTYVKLADGVFYGDVANAKTLGTDPVDNSKTINGHKFVDLNLPSGLLWAETNIGAETAADDGNYYAWGETETQISNTYNWSSYTYGTSKDDLTKYNSTDNKTVLDKEDDAAYVNWGSYCRMPTNDDFTELRNSSNCTWTWTSKTTSDGSSIEGYTVTSVKNDNSIFLPASGYRDDEDLEEYGSVGCYWSSTLYSSYSNDAYYLSFYSGNHYQSNYYRYDGHTIRPVAEFK